MFSHLIEVLYLTAATIAIGACVPQLRQLIKAKASDELNLSTWVLWAMTQTITLVYVISIGNTLMTVVNTVWVSFYVAMAALIIKYRYKGRSASAIDMTEAPIETKA